MRSPCAALFAATQVWIGTVIPYAAAYRRNVEFESQKKSCSSNKDCGPNNPICQTSGTCGTTRRVEPLSTLPLKLRTKVSGLSTQFPKGDLNNRQWTKWIRSALPIMGTNTTSDGALFEAAFFMEGLFVKSQDQYDGEQIYRSMLDSQNYMMTVWGNCPNAFIHPAGWSSTGKRQSGGGGSPDNTFVSEDWLMRYPQSCSSKDVDCRNVASGSKCNNCESGCETTTAHEIGHSLHLWSEQHLGLKRATMESVFQGSSIEWPAWSAEEWFQVGKAHPGHPEHTWFTKHLNFSADSTWMHKTRDKRCSSLDGCSDARERTIYLETDKWDVSGASVTWTLSNSQESCDQACGRKGKTCDLKEIQKITTDQSIRAAAKSAGHSCAMTVPWAYDNMPGICWEHCCHGACDKACAYGNTGVRNCHTGAWWNYRRFCPCN